MGPHMDPIIVDSEVCFASSAETASVPPRCPVVAFAHQAGFEVHQLAPQHHTLHDARQRSAHGCSVHLKAMWHYPRAFCPWTHSRWTACVTQRL